MTHNSPFSRTVTSQVPFCSGTELFLFTFSNSHLSFLLNFEQFFKMLKTIMNSNFALHSAFRSYKFGIIIPFLRCPPAKKRWLKMDLK